MTQHKNVLVRPQHFQNFIQNHIREDLGRFVFFCWPTFVKYRYPLIKMNPTFCTWTPVSLQQSPTDGNGTSGDSHSLWTKARSSSHQGSFRECDEPQSHWASSSTGVMTIMVHIVVSLPAAACLNFHYPEPDERSRVVSPGRRVSSDVVTLELRAPSAPCASFAVHLLQLLARCTQQSDSLLNLIFPPCGLLIRLYLSHIMWLSNKLSGASFSSSPH